MKNFLLIIFLVALFSCGETQSQKKISKASTDSLTNTSQGVVNENFYPKEATKVLNDTIVSGYKIHTEIYPITAKYQTLYSNHIATKYREYELKIFIKNQRGDVIFDRLINKYEFEKVVDRNLSYYFLRGIYFSELKNNEFKFNIKIGETDNEREYSWIEYFISEEGKTRARDSKNNFSKIVIENVIEKGEQAKAIITVPDSITNEDFKKYPVTLLKDGDIWLLSEFGKKRFKFIESDILGFVRLMDKIWFYYLIDGEPQIYSVKLSNTKEIEWNVTISNEEDNEHLFEDEMYGSNASLYFLSDTALALECDPHWPFSFENLFVYSLSSKELSFYSGSIPEEMWNKYPAISQKAEELKKMIVVEAVGDIENLFINYPNKKIRLTDTRNMARDIENGGGGIEFRVSHNGSKVIYFVVEAVGDFEHGEGYIINIDGTYNTNICSDGFGITYWNKANDNLYILDNNTLSVIYGKANKIIKLDEKVDQFEIAF